MKELILAMIEEVKRGENKIIYLKQKQTGKLDAVCSIPKEMEKTA